MRRHGLWLVGLFSLLGLYGLLFWLAYPYTKLGTHAFGMIVPALIAARLGTRRGLIAAAATLAFNVALSRLLLPGAFGDHLAPEVIPGSIALFVIAFGVGRIHDLSERVRQLEAAQKDVVHAANQASKMAALGEMAAGIAHEINNPLTVIDGRARLIGVACVGEDPLSRTEILKSAESILRTTARIVAIVRGLKAFSQGGERDPIEDVSVRQILDETLSLCGERLQAYGITLSVGGDQAARVACRPTQIGQVLLNLLNNAHDAVAEPGAAKWIRIEATQRGPELEIAVSDGGSGVPHAIVDKIMQPFFTTKEVGKGTGLGLSVSKGIIEDHGGRLYVDGSVPHTRFVVVLPLRPGAQRPSGALASSSMA